MSHSLARKANRTRQSSFRRNRLSGRSRAGSSNTLAFELLEPRLVLDGGLMISELMAINNDAVHGLRDGDGELSDWLELHNPGTEAVNLTGWTLKDGGNEWTFPASWQISPPGNPSQYEDLLTLGPGEYLVVMASDKGDPTGTYVNEHGYYIDGEEYLHTNFRLSGSGEYLGLLDDTGAVVHEYDEYPRQMANISYGIAQDIDRTDFVSAGATAKYLVPGSDPGDWTTVGFDDVGWSSGETALGFADTVPGFAVFNYKAHSEVPDLNTALNVIGNPSQYSAVYSENAAVINYWDSSGQGHYVDNQSDFPGFLPGQDYDYYVIDASGYLTIPAAGEWSFGVNSDDGFQLTISGATTTAAFNSHAPLGTDTISYTEPRGVADTLGVFDFPQAGVYEVRLVMFENWGGAAVELFGKQGHFTSYDSGFRLVGDTAGGGLEVVSEPVTGGAGGSAFAGLIETDVEDEMKGVNATMFVRIPFSVADPAQLESLLLKMKYDDGYVAYLNGQKIAERNAPGSPTWNSHATADRTDAQATAWDNVDVSAHLGLLNPDDGNPPPDNVLAIHAMNYAVDNGDFLILPELVQIRYLGLGEHFFATATPGDANTDEYWLYVADTEFSHDRGFYEERLDLEITTDTDSAQIYYTTDGSEPGQTNGTPYTGPIRIARTTVVRAVAFKEHYAPSNVDTQTYVFLEEVINQPNDPEGFPLQWRTEPADYEMDPDITNTVDPETLKEALLSIPTMSLVMDMDDLFDYSTGIYSNPTGQGVGWERSGSLEYFDPNTSDEFQVNAGVRIYGGVGRQPQFKKHTFRILFKSDYGPTKLRYPLFGDTATDEFDTIILRSNFNDAWVWAGTNVQFIRDEFAGRTQVAMGDPSRQGNFVHLYINGLYWGLFNPCERPDQSFSASYFGGDKEDWDVVNSGQPTGESSAAPYNTFLSYDDNYDLTTIEGYQLFMGNNPDGTNNPAYDNYLDPYNYINYLLLNHYIGNRDWPSHNWYAGKRRGSESTGFKWYSWDAEWIIGLNSGLYENRTGVTSHLCEPYGELRYNPEFKMLFADLAHKHLFNNGALTPAQSIARYGEMADEVELAVITESARWGDVRSGTPYDIEDWRNQRDWILGTYFTERTQIVIDQLKGAGLYPNVVAPSFSINGSYQHGGTIDSGDSLTIYAPAGTIYYTTDGTDPRQLGGGISDTAVPYTGAITLERGTHVKSRVYTGGQWSAVNEATFYIDLAPDIRITEIMYNPAEPTADEQAHGYTNNELFEFIEIKNLSDTKTLPLEGLRFSDGVRFTFPDISIDPGEHVVVVKNQAAFNHRYSTFTGTSAGQYSGSLNNAGERVELDAPIGGIVQDFTYDDGWYGHTDGDGFSLTIRDPQGELELWGQQQGWRASAGPGGTPGSDDALVTPGAIVITEALAHSNSPLVDTIELYNTTADQTIDVGGWFMSDARRDESGRETLLTKWQIPSPTEIAPGGYVVFYESGGGDPANYFGTAFSLSELGDDVYLSSNAPGLPGVAGGYREHVDFGASPNGISFGLYVKSTGSTDFTLLSERSFGWENAYPYLEDLVINEVMYHPADPTADEIGAGFLDDDQFEFLEIYNRSASETYTLTDFYVGNGIGFTFGWYDAEYDPGDPQPEAWTLEPGATATWNAALPAGLADYEVFARWDLLDPEGKQRELDGRARYRITHHGGSTEVLRDQEPEEDDEGPGYMDPEGWVSLGTYEFDGSGQVVLTRGTDNPGNWTIADQVKFVRSGFSDVVVDDPTLDSWYTSNGPAEIGPGQYVVVVKDYDAFDRRYDVTGNNISVAGVYTANLSNNGEKIKLFRLGDPDPSGVIPNYRIDYVNYDDEPPWPTDPDGRGPALNRLHTDQYGNDPINWEASAFWGTPGAANVTIDRTPPSVPENLAGHVTADPETIHLTWDAAHDAESYVDHYVIHRDDELFATSTTTSYDDTDVVIAVPYSYQVSAVNRDGYEGDLSTAVVVAVPGIVSYSIPDSNHIEMTFTEALDPATADMLDNYVFTGGTLADMDLTPDGLTVTLTTAEELIIGNPYSVTVQNVTTLSGNEMPDGQQIYFTYEPQGAGFILREYWTGIGGGSINDLINHPNYPDNPTGETFPTWLEGPVDWANDYGTRIRGYVHPPVSGNYTFWVAGDDNSALYLSTDGKPASMALIASVPGWTNWREWTKYAEQQSAPVSLVAGQKYYIEVLHKEGTGLDNISVRWQLPDGSWENPANPNEPIPGVRLSPWVIDTEPPTADIIDIDPDPRNTPVDQIEIIFSEEVTGVDVDDLTLTRDGGANLLTGSEQLSTTNGVLWRLSGLTGLTSAPGSYTLTLHAAGSGIEDAAGNALAADASDSWQIVISGPIPDIIDVQPDPRNSPVSQIQIVFSEAVTGFDVGDLTLTRDGGDDLLTGGGFLETADNVTWILGDLDELTEAAGTYVLTLTAAGSGIINAEEEPLTLDASDTWVTDTEVPTADVLDVDPDPRDSAVQEIAIVFSEAVTGLDVDDLSLTRNGGENLLTGTEPLTTTDNVTWTVGGLAELTGTGAQASGFVAFNDHVPGAGTHVNTTIYAANGTASGPLKNIETGDDTGVTLTTSQSGVRFQSSQGVPAPGTDAYELFNGYVYFGSGGGASIEVDGADRYTHTFSGLATGDGVTYTFYGTAIRGEINYSNRWTKVTLVGAEPATAGHSEGVGVIELSDTEVALWTGYNSASGQGWVAGWTDIDPGDDGQFSVVSQQYRGSVPTTVHPTGMADGSKGYGLTGIRLEEVAATGEPGTYTLRLTATGSAIADAAGNPLAADASDTWVIHTGGPDTEPPTADVVDVAPDARSTPVDEIDIVFSEPVTGFDLNDLSLTRDDMGNLLTGDEPLTTDDGLTWTLGGLTELTNSAGAYTLELTAADSGIQDMAGNPLAADASDSWVIVSQVVDSSRRIFYNNSAFDGNNPAANDQDDQAIATDKHALSPDQTATFANYTSYSRGVNGLMMDITCLPPVEGPIDPTVYFDFKAGSTGDPGGWAIAPDPSSATVRESPAAEHARRVTLIWPDYFLRNQWLQVTVLANDYTGLAAQDVFYFGNAVGEAGNSTSDAEVNDSDVLLARSNPHGFFNPATVTCDYDYNRDARVNATDMLIARNNQTDLQTALRLIDLSGAEAAGGDEQSLVATSLGSPWQPPPEAVPDEAPAKGTESIATFDVVLEQAVASESSRRQSVLGKWAWLCDFEQTNVQRRPSKKDNLLETAVDGTFAAYWP